MRCQRIGQGLFLGGQSGDGIAALARFAAQIGQFLVTRGHVDGLLTQACHNLAQRHGEIIHRGAHSIERGPVRLVFSSLAPAFENGVDLGQPGAESLIRLECCGWFRFVVPQCWRHESVDLCRYLFRQARPD
ncbi:hypothetical protein IWY39_004870 [Sphingobium sp. JAI105]|nr:hypothetical protein [Sphingobium sp. JAI105]